MLLLTDRSRSFAGRSARIARRSRAVAIARAAETRIPAELRPRPTGRFVVGVHFDGDEDSLYQLTQWLAPLENLAASLREALEVEEPLGILCRSAEHALRVAEVTLCLSVSRGSRRDFALSWNSRSCGSCST